jgi:two-component system phosphate regulon sensor histidine kinase PhoR
VSPVIDSAGGTSGAVVMFRDVTALKKLETAKSMFVSMVAHEVKSPLAATEGWLNLILSGILRSNPEEERKMIQRSLLRVRTLRNMVSELLNLTAIETGNFTLRRTSVEVPAMVAEVVEAHRDKAAEKGVALVFEGNEATPLPCVLADKDALSIVYSNLVDNAIKYTPAGGKVWVGVANSGIYVQVTVRDTGIGMSPADCEKVFDEFYRARNEHTASIPGTGLGLSLVRRLAELHQGTVSLVSSLGAGSEFTVRIPIAEG